jgi:hypothetical protein
MIDVSDTSNDSLTNYLNGDHHSRLSEFHVRWKTWHTSLDKSI